MDRVDGLDHVNHMFSDGDPTQGREGTEVPARWLNDVQENLCRTIESAGIELAEGAYEQLRDAIIHYVENRSLKNILQKNVANIPIVGLVVDPLLFKSARIDFTIYKKTSEGEIAEAQSFMAFYYDASETWKIQNLFIETPEDQFSGVKIKHVIDAETKALSFEYDSPDMAGMNYDGRITFRITRLI